LVGGLYGLSLGAAFFGESMFSLEPDASKIALVHLVRRVVDWGFHFIDCQVTTEHLLRMGATEWPRVQFLAALELALAEKSRVGSWAQLEAAAGP
jgi:leucyl/phenylalanyl-tRNA--protein transferase